MFISTFLIVEGPIVKVGDAFYDLKLSRAILEEVKLRFQPVRVPHLHRELMSC